MDGEPVISYIQDLNRDNHEVCRLYDTQEVAATSESWGRALSLKHKDGSFCYVDGSSNATVDFFLDVFEYCKEFDFPTGQGPGDDVDGSADPTCSKYPVPVASKRRMSTRLYLNRSQGQNLFSK